MTVVEIECVFQDGETLTALKLPVSLVRLSKLTTTFDYDKLYIILACMPLKLFVPVTAVLLEECAMSLMNACEICIGLTSSYLINYNNNNIIDAGRVGEV